MAQVVEAAPVRGAARAAARERKLTRSENARCRENPKPLTLNPTLSNFQPSAISGGPSQISGGFK